MKVNRYTDAWVIRAESPDEQERLDAFMSGFCGLTTNGLRGSADVALYGINVKLDKQSTRDFLESRNEK